MGPAAPSSTTGTDSTLIAASDVLKKLLMMAERVARSSAAVLICGETGSGKELIAAHVHRHSFRAAQPFIEINCAAIPENLVESELFGYEKGAFSGADAAKPGMFELAEHGTVFLDEIGELDVKVQAKLLRILDGAPYYRLGGNRKINTNARIIAATNRELEKEVELGNFRADLFHRIAQFQLRVPPLRERPDDILPLAEHFLAQAGMPDTRFSAEALEILRTHTWTGNARELRNVVLQAAIMADGSEIVAEHIPAGVRQRQDKPAEPEPATGTIDGAERTAIRRAIEASGGNHTAAAEMLGISRRTLLRKLKAYREEGEPLGSVLGKLSAQQHQSYRSSVNLPVTIEAGEKSFTDLCIVNISLGGIGVTGVKNAFELTGKLNIKFDIPTGTIEATGSMQWAEPGGRVGLRFLSLTPASLGLLERWLRERQLEEGWTVQQPLSTAAPTT